ncbi:hypothetical protein GALMADRAFT_237615 [Galerina marginata CBS 339.88]|uniref:Uncharacterized protein n=1 Tax=Galerina marginata (strain CBS 339.88) TaxID=685588 RepID=A0A067TTQ1_GALM3|nr:hypothetical protein GALMADRAFT_237615 [Galerina marginata CBS 339.88]
MPLTRHFSSSPSKLPHSSDTELYETPLRKRFRNFEEDDSPASSFSSSPRKRQRRDSPKKPPKDVDLEQVLRDIIADPTNHNAVVELKTVPRDERTARRLVNRLLHSTKAAVMKRRGSKKHKLLETELYLEWLNELDYVASALDVALNAKVPGTRRRITGLGRVCYTILYNLVDEFIDEVNAHHDGPSTKSSEPCLYPATMTLVEEAKDPSTDDRSDKAVQLAEEALRGIDKVLADAVRRHKAECGRNNPSLAIKISAQEHALAKGCCLLCEQTGYGTVESDIGDTLMDEARGVLMQWKSEYEDCEDQLDDSD